MTTRVVLLLGVLLFSSAAYAQLTDSERRGKALYLRGESPSGKEITAMLGDIDVPASTLSCAGCHGLRGEGKSEGGVTAGNLTWSNLIRPYGHTHPSGRKHSAFNDKLFTRALVQGLDPTGNQLAVAMPRYEMSPEDISDLIAYLKRIETDRDPGLTETSIKVATILPKEGALADVGAAMKDVLTAYFANINDQGGIYNRRIELETIDAGANAAVTAANTRKVVENGELFAIVGGLSAGADKELAAVTRETEIPYIGPATLLTLASAQNNRNLFYLLPGASQQARSLVNFAAARPELKKSPLAIVHSENELASAAAAAIEDRANSFERAFRCHPLGSDSESGRCANGFLSECERRERVHQRGGGCELDAARFPARLVDGRRSTQDFTFEF
jgi:mono/diheme cytochrome c family protein